MERSLDVRTGESITIHYELAGLGSRFLAVAIDLALQLGTVLAIVLAFALSGRPLALALAKLSGNLSKTGAAVLVGILVLAVFALFFGYFIIFELWWSGRTPGKRALQIRVVRDAGFPLDAGAATVRNIVRVLEFGLGFYALAAVSALLSPQNKRLGDFAAGTIVVRERPYEAADLDAYLIRERAGDDGLPPPERELVERYVARRALLEPAARTRLAAEIAHRIRPLLRASFEHLDDDALLEHLGRGAAASNART